MSKGISRDFARTFLIAACIVLFACTGALAQSSTANIFGTTTDGTGAAIAGAQITATNTATGTSRTATTNDSGNYSISFLPVGTYRVETKSPGFQTVVQTGVVLNVGTNVRVDPVMKVGAVET